MIYFRSSVPIPYNVTFSATGALLWRGWGGVCVRACARTPMHRKAPEGIEGVPSTSHFPPQTWSLTGLTKRAKLANYAATGSTCLYLLSAEIVLGIELRFWFLQGKHFNG